MTPIASPQDLFWTQIAQTPSLYNPTSPVVVQEKTVSAEAKTLQTEMFASCTSIDPFAQDFFKSPPKKVLDLGAGIGSNTLTMALGGSHVTALDESKQLLLQLAKASVACACPSSQLRLRRADLTKLDSYEGPFNLVVAIDILPYIPPTTVRSTMEKIHACLEKRGLLIGTIFTTHFHPIMREMMSQIGAHFYDGDERFVTDLLNYSGFSIIKIQRREEGGFRFKAEKM